MSEVIEIENGKTTRKGNPLMRAVTEDDLRDNQDFLYQKLDLMFKQITDEKLINAALWKGYLEWRKDIQRREQVKAVDQIKRMAEAAGMTPEQLAKLLAG